MIVEGKEYVMETTPKYSEEFMNGDRASREMIMHGVEGALVINMENRGLLRLVSKEEVKKVFFYLDSKSSMGLS